MIRKVCGMRDPKNMLDLAATGTTVMGLIFYKKSPRYFNGELPQLPSNMALAGVFVNSSISEVTDKAETYDLSYIQLHGEETPEYCQSLKSALEEKDLSPRIIKALPVAAKEDLSPISGYKGVTDLFLFDTRGRNRGGNGEQFDWSILKDYSADTPFLLSGGIGPEDAGAIITFLASPWGARCAGIDLNSRFEIRPGLKDTRLIKEFNTQLVEGNLKQKNTQE
ncbi:phosphoribosylanthranilate isomerase [Robertkochia flava]|uniref:phosphoribosylanthranilate isomerase n=1 Tax=Robertkochia flava TaxID=3447986 RepID=UPI001CCEEE6A|nr:phosphoribosylanthranilate isomerase [Robertkochia marina]